MNEKIVALNIGSKYLTATMSRSELGENKIIASVAVKSRGVKRGNVEDIALFTSDLEEVINRLKKATKEKIADIYIGLSTDNIRIVESKGICSLDKNREIDKEQIEKAYLNGKTAEIEEDECIADAIVKNFYTAESGYIENPLCMKSKELEVELKLIVCKKEIIGILKTIMINLNLNIIGFILAINALNTVLIKDENKDLEEKNNVLINFGAEKIEIGIFNKSKIQSVSTIPLGSNDITKDIAIVTKIAEEVAEEIKVTNSSNFITTRNNFGKIEVGNEKIEATLLYEVINARLEEITGYIKKSIETFEDYDRIDNVIVVGDGIVNFENINRFLEEIFNKNIVIFTKEEVNLENYSIIMSNAIVKEVYDRLKLVYKKDVFSIVIYNKAKETVSKNTIFKDKELKENKGKLSKVLGFLGDIF